MRRRPRAVARNLDFRRTEVARRCRTGRNRNLGHALPGRRGKRHLVDPLREAGRIERRALLVDRHTGTLLRTAAEDVRVVRQRPQRATVEVHVAGAVHARRRGMLDVLRLQHACVQIECRHEVRCPLAHVEMVDLHEGVRAIQGRNRHAAS